MKELDSYNRLNGKLIDIIIVTGFVKTPCINAVTVSGRDACNTLHVQITIQYFLLTTPHKGFFSDNLQF